MVADERDTSVLVAENSGSRLVRFPRLVGVVGEVGLSLATLFGAATLLLLTWFTVVAGTARGNSVSVWLLAVPTVMFVVGIVGYGVYVVRGGKYRVPDDLP